jgi:hypothetical protein
MNQEILNSLNKMELRMIDVDMGTIKKEYITKLPNDYFEFMLMYDGAVGFLEDNYLDFWTINNVIELNPYFPEEDFSKQVIIIGSNGSGSLFGYDLLDKTFFETDEFQMNREEIIRCGSTFLEFIKYLEIKKD